MQPWLTEEAITFLDRFFIAHHTARMLECGSGNSTPWFAQRAQHLISIDHNVEWHKKVQDLCKEFKNVDLRLIQGEYSYVCATFPADYFDIILIDGKDRVHCVQESIRILKPGGILMLDDAERPRYQPVFELLKNWPCTISEQIKTDKLGMPDAPSKTAWWIKV